MNSKTNPNADLIQQYVETRKVVNRSLKRTRDWEQRSLLLGILSDLTWVIYYMEHGHPPSEVPEYYAGVEVPIDPYSLDRLDQRFVTFLWNSYEKFKEIGCTEKPAQRQSLASLYNVMTKKQREVWELYIRGYGIREIARELDVHPTTVQEHLQAGSQRVIHQLEKETVRT